MPGPPDHTIYSTRGGHCQSNGSTHGGARDASAADYAWDSSNLSDSTVAVKYASGKSANSVHRAFLYFDVSGVDSKTVVTDASLKIRGQVNSNADIICVKSTTAFGGDGGTALSTGDFDAIYGFSAGSTNSMSGNVTDYSSEITTWSTSGYNTIDLNTAAKTDIQNNSHFIVAIVEYDSDYLDVNVEEKDVAVGMRWHTFSGTSSEPKIEIYSKSNLYLLSFGL